MIQAGSDMEASFLWSSFNGSRKYYASYQGREAIKQSYPATIPHTSLEAEERTDCF